MRGLRHLIPDDLQDKLNSSPTFAWIVTLLLVGLGILFVVKGINGVKHKRITGKHDKVYEGTTAQVLGVIYVVVGLAVAIVAAGMRITG